MDGKAEEKKGWMDRGNDGMGWRECVCVVRICMYMSRIELTVPQSFTCLSFLSMLGSIDTIIGDCYITTVLLSLLNLSTIKLQLQNTLSSL